jgi:type VI secretion system secreted protein VgrG
MDDGRGKEKIELFTAERKNILTLDADSQGHRVRLASEEGAMELCAAKTLLLDSGETQTVEAGGDHIVTIENAQRLMIRDKEIEVCSATDILLKAGENILMQDRQGRLLIAAGEGICLQAGESRIELDADGRIRLDGREILSIATGRQRLQGSTIELN